MPTWLMSALRTGAQSLLGLVAAWLATHGVTLPTQLQDWLLAVAVPAVAIAVYTGAVRWLESRAGDSPLARAARAIAHVLMLGTGAQQPLYVKPAAARVSPTTAAAALAPFVRRQ